MFILSIILNLFLVLSQINAIGLPLLDVAATHHDVIDLQYYIATSNNNYNNNSKQYVYLKNFSLFDITTTNAVAILQARDSGSLAFCKIYWGRCLSLSVILGLIILCTVIGNTFVIAAVILERNLHNVANYLIVSLGVADLMVAVMVMPIAAYQEVTNYWTLGNIVCDIWTSFDVLCCTASILHLVAIALDRYWAITKVDYGAKRTSRRIITMIAMIWSVATVISVLPHIFGLSYDDTNVGTPHCQLTDNLGYQLFSTLGAFYLPLIIMCVIYWKIFQSAKFRIRKKAFQRPPVRNTVTCTSEFTTNTRSSNLKHDEQKSVSYQNVSISSKLNVNSGEKINSSASSLSEFKNSALDLCNNAVSDVKRIDQADDVQLITQQKMPLSQLQQQQLQQDAILLKNEQRSLFKFKFKNFLFKINLTNFKRPQLLNGHVLNSHLHATTTATTTTVANRFVMPTSNGNGSSHSKAVRQPEKEVVVLNDAVSSSTCTDTPTQQHNDLNTNNSDLCIYTSELINFYDKNLYFKVPIALPESDCLSQFTTTATEAGNSENCAFLPARQKPLSDSSEYFYVLDNCNSVSDYCLSRKNCSSLKINGRKGKKLNLSRISSASNLSINADVPTTAAEAVAATATNEPSTDFGITKPLPKSLTNTSIALPSPTISAQAKSVAISNPPVQSFSNIQANPSSAIKKRNRIDIKRERKAAKTLGIIMSCFILCWLPFFIMQIMFAMCKECAMKFVDSPIVTILTWLGYLNSLLNPIIYTIFSPDFRDAFAKILFGKYRKKHRRYFK